MKAVNQLFSHHKFKWVALKTPELRYVRSNQQFTELVQELIELLLLLNSEKATGWNNKQRIYEV